MIELLWIASGLWLLQWVVLYQLMKVDSIPRTNLGFASLMIQMMVIIVTMTALAACFVKVSQ